MKNSLKSLINFFGFNLSKAISNEDVRVLIKKLKPYHVGIDLIRLGPDGDSGYLVPDDLKNIEACFSPGCDNKFQFEEDCFDKQMKIFIADKSVSSLNVPKKFNFIEKFINPVSNNDFISMDQWVNESLENKNSDLILQMDIEGDEYINLLNISDNLLNRFRIIVIEFHHLEQLPNPFFYNIASNVFKRLLINHTCVHIHPNNNIENINLNGIEIPPLLEFTFLRNDRCLEKTERFDFPHKLDSDCTPRKTIKLPEIWYK